MQVFDAEKDFLDRTDKQDAQFAYAAVVNNQTVLLREGLFPITGKAAIVAHLNALEGKWSWTPKLRGPSSANDFAYVVGNYLGKSNKGETLKASMCAYGYATRVRKGQSAGRLREKS